MDKSDKYRRLTRKNQMDLAKLVRNLAHTERVKVDVARMLANYLGNLDNFFDRKTFMGIATSTLSGDFRTDWCSDVDKGKHNEEV